MISEKLRRLRYGDIRKVLRDRCGHTLPDDDAGRADLELFLDVVSLVANDARGRMKNVCETWADWMDTAQSYELIENIMQKPEYLRWPSNEQLGQMLNLTYADRLRLGVKMIAPADLTPEEFAQKRKERRRELERERQRQRRLKNGAKPRSIVQLATSDAHLKPWLKEGISRRTWYRKRRGTKLALLRTHTNS